MKKEILNLQECCEYLGLSKSKVFKLIQNREVKHYRNSKRLIFFKREDLDSWMLQNPVETKVS